MSFHASCAVRARSKATFRVDLRAARDLAQWLAVNGCSTARTPADGSVGDGQRAARCSRSAAPEIRDEEALYASCGDRQASTTTNGCSTTCRHQEQDLGEPGPANPCGGHRLPGNALLQASRSNRWAQIVQPGRRWRQIGARLRFRPDDTTARPALTTWRCESPAIGLVVRLPESIGGLARSSSLDERGSPFASTGRRARPVTAWPSWRSDLGQGRSGDEHRSFEGADDHAGDLRLDRPRLPGCELRLDPGR